MKIILGSKGKGRQEVMKEAGYAFEVVTADIDEKAVRLDDPQKLVLALAHAKADAILKKLAAEKLDEPFILITGDQVAVCDGKILEKPKDEQEAREFLHSYSRHPLETVSSLLATNTATGKSAEGVDVAKMYFRVIPEEAIDAALKIGRIMHCAGAMRCEEGPLSPYLARLEGTQDSTSGLPLKLLEQLMREVGEPKENDEPSNGVYEQRNNR